MDLWNDAAVANGDYPGDPDLTPLTPEQRAELGDQLVADVTELKEKVAAPDFDLTLADITEGAKGLLDEVSAPDGKLPGEENEFAHTDLYDFYANVEGSYVAFDTVRDLAVANDAADLVDDIDARFADMFALLDTYGSYDAGFVFYDTVDDAQRAELAAKLNALSDPMSKLTAAVVKN
jgi:iron uptake system component EfeO